MLLDADECQLVLVDYQARLMPVIHDNTQVLAHAMRLAKIAQLLEVPVWGTEQNPQRLGENPPELRALCRRTLAKMHFSAVADGLADWLRPPAKPAGGNARSLPRHLQKPAQSAPERGSIVLAGCEAHVCVQQTVLGLIDAGRRVYVVRDALGSRRAESKETAIRRMERHGAEIVTTEMVLFEWLGTAEHPQFRRIIALVK